MKNEKPYQLLSRITILSTPIILTLALLGINPATLLVSKTWRSTSSFLQYYAYILYTDHIVYNKTKNHQTSFTYAIISATATGYLYEVPLWLNRGIFNLIRTSQYSLILFDFGFIAFIYLIVLTRNNKMPWTALVVYLVYVIIFTINPGPLNQAWYSVTKIPTVIMRRIPAMMLTHFLFTTKSSNKHIKY